MKHYKGSLLFFTMVLLMFVGSEWYPTTVAIKAVVLIALLAVILILTSLLAREGIGGK